MIKMVLDEGRGFIEYIPGEYAWRPVNARGYMFVHCIWIVGAGKGKGHGKLLLKQCERDARKAGMHGVAMVTSEGTWLVGKNFLQRHGYESVDQAPPSFELMVKNFHNAPSPSFTGRWDEKAKRLGRGLTIVRSEQCPYVDASVNMMLQEAKEKEIPARVVELTSSEEVRRIAPSAYGVFGVVMDGKLVSYHPMGRPDFLRRIDELRQVWPRLARRDMCLFYER